MTIFISGAIKKSETTKSNNEILLADNILKTKPSIEKKEENIDNQEVVSDEVNDAQPVLSTTVINDEKEDENNVNTSEEIVYDGLTKQQLIDKLNRNLNSTLSGKGEIFAEHSLELGLDPYLAVAIVLHETGCTWDCSTLVKMCNNVGGQKGTPSCGSGSYRSYPTLDEGIIGYMDNLYNNFYALGLTTPEAINPKYASSTAWAGKINYYIDKIRAS